MVLTRQQSRSLDQRALAEFGIPGLVLMENAGRGAVNVLLGLGVQGRVLICCGKGNNGGDGLVMARHLDNRRVPVSVLLFARPEELSPDAAINYNIVMRSGIPVLATFPPDVAVLQQALAGAQWVVDALFGTGLTGAIREPLAAVVETINASSRQVLAVDIPSGLDCDTGMPLGPTIRAQHTVTFVAPKQGFRADQSRAWTGTVHMVDIGAPRILVDSLV